MKCHGRCVLWSFRTDVRMVRTGIGVRKNFCTLAGWIFMLLCSEQPVFPQIEATRVVNLGLTLLIELEDEIYISSLRVNKANCPIGVQNGYTLIIPERVSAITGSRNELSLGLNRVLHGRLYTVSGRRFGAEEYVQKRKIRAGYVLGIYATVFQTEV